MKWKDVPESWKDRCSGNGNKRYIDKDGVRRYATDDVPVSEEYRPCAKCGHYPINDGEDYCFHHLGKVINACCVDMVRKKGISNLTMVLLSVDILKLKTVIRRPTMNELTPQEIVEKLLYLDSHIESDNDIRVLSAAASIVRQYANGELRLVVHGRWLNFVGDFSTAECNKCGEVYEVSPDEKPCENYFNAFKQSYKFCPSCGALMGGKDDSNE